METKIRQITEKLFSMSAKTPFHYLRILSLFTAISIILFFNEVYGESKEVLYVPIGDSYTIGEGASLEESWPALLTFHLRAKGIPIKILANPARTGWTTAHAIQYALPVYKSLKPTFATLLIGVNDWVQGADAETFRKHLRFLLDNMLTVLPQKDHLLIITIPDFSVTPAGANFSDGRNISEGIAQFNSIIVEEAHKRDLPVVDIYPISQKMKEDSSLIAADRLHPSAKEYAVWEEMIFKEAFRILSRNTP